MIDLLEPRYEVIAPWPGMPQHSPVGTIISEHDGIVRFDMPEGMTCETLFDHWDTLQDYPHLFKRLAWYERRQPEDMPEHVRVNDVVYKFIKLHFDKFANCWCLTYLHQAGRDGSKFIQRGDFFLPATATEYNAYMEKKI